ncbi:Cytochrome P450 89A9 [Hibiscus syriacus]|uniref:Cytochrome P450 89A9 n=1 Tax=Hibiscus syriacus TaxID=106335 RepID=A0A6A3C4I2_HIBSY|nr:cytochrome P450 89A2-like [Hibiscus syriacus]KAE8721939.1 Cytochrome P450 89A9 [Hibiscus syriacus]
MEPGVIILFSICMSAVIMYSFNLLITTGKHSHRLPPGPSTFPIIGNFLWLRLSSSQFEQRLRSIHAKFGPIVTLWIGFHPAIFIADRSLAHHALIQNGVVFADRPEPLVTNKAFNISSAFYGPLWRLLRRNLTSEILHPSRVKSYNHARNWVLKILLDRLESQHESGGPVYVLNHFQHAMFCLLVLMSFGDKLETEQVRKIEDVHRTFLLDLRRFNVLNFMPSVTKIIFRRRWLEFKQLRRKVDDVLIPLIRARRNIKKEIEMKQETDHEFVLAYVDTLLDLQLPEENRKLKEEEMVTLCSEFLIAGTDTTSTALQWIMANLVKNQNIQEKLYTEIKLVMGEKGSTEMVKEEDVHNMPYLKAVILETLRRHPPAHFVVPHAATEDVVLNGWSVPKKATLNFMVAEMGWDSTVWEDPMEFKPERFNGMGEGFDISGSREIKMMPFGVGRRICPGLALAMLHLEYFVANLIWRFKWSAVNGDEVDLSEKQEFTIVMKYPLQAHINPRL